MSLRVRIRMLDARLGRWWETLGKKSKQRRGAVVTAHVAALCSVGPRSARRPHSDTPSLWVGIEFFASRAGS